MTRALAHHPQEGIWAGTTPQMRGRIKALWPTATAPERLALLARAADPRGRNLLTLAPPGPAQTTTQPTAEPQEQHL